MLHSKIKPTVKRYFMCLFLEMLWVKKSRNLSGGKYFPVLVNIFPLAENLELLF